MKDLLYVSIVNSNRNGVFVKLAKTWVDIALRAGVDNYIIYCCDDSSFETLGSLGLKVKRAPTEQHESPPCINIPNQDFGEIPFFKLIILEDALRSFGNDVVFTDADAFILQDPSLAINDLLQKFDILISTVNHDQAYPPEIREKLGFTLCSGWFALKNNENSIKLLHNLRKFNFNGKNLQQELNSYLLNDISLVKDGINSNFKVDNVHIKLLNQSFINRSKNIIDSYVFHAFFDPGAALSLGKELLENMQSSQ